jgi:hypothetical protein
MTIIRPVLLQHSLWYPVGSQMEDKEVKLDCGC